VADAAVKIVCSDFCGLQEITTQQATALLNALRPVEDALDSAGRDHDAD
jgi:hypothetical protein